MAPLRQGWPQTSSGAASSSYGFHPCRVRPAGPFPGAAPIDGLLERDRLGVGCQPLLERLQLGVELASQLDAPRLHVGIVEVALELEHVPHVVGAGKAEAAVNVG